MMCSGRRSYSPLLSPHNESRTRRESNNSSNISSSGWFYKAAPATDAALSSSAKSSWSRITIAGCAVVAVVVISFTVTLDVVRPQQHPDFHTSRSSGGLPLMRPSSPTSDELNPGGPRMRQKGIADIELSRAGATTVVRTRPTILVSNFYTQGKPVQLYPWRHVAEPHRPAKLEVESWGDLDDDDMSFRWDVEGHTVGHGAAVEVLFPVPGEYKCTVTLLRTSSWAASSAEADKNTDDSDVESHGFVITVKYVRREIRSLTDRDRETFFNGISVIQRVPTAVGQAIYGSKYYSKDYFNRLHLYYGSDTSCDRWHGGPGFPTSHMALTLMFEQTLQAINPSIAIPYWDFTIESMFLGTEFRNSGVFSDDWFGSAYTSLPLRAPSRGRFGYVPAMRNASEYSDVFNSYGILRSPWNSDSTPFMTRHDHMFGFKNNRKPSGCLQYRDSIRKTNWMELSVSLNTVAHGHVHELMGGTWSKDYAKVVEPFTSRIVPFSHTVQTLTKKLWRAKYFTCPEYCGSDVPWTSCQCTCDAANLAGKSPSKVLHESGVLDTVFFYDSSGTLISAFEDDKGNVLYTLPGYSEEESDDIFAQLLRALCTPARIGTSYEAASTNDMTFWVLHPTVDRAWHLARLNNPFFNHTWVYDEGACYGQNPDDRQPFHDLFSVDDDLHDNKHESNTATGGGGTAAWTGANKTRAAKRHQFSPAFADNDRVVMVPYPAGNTRAHRSDINNEDSISDHVQEYTHVDPNRGSLRAGRDDVGGDSNIDGTSSGSARSSGGGYIRGWVKPGGRGSGRDVLQRKGETVKAKGAERHYYTNSDLYRLFAPGGLDVPYLYDNFEWPHCERLGIFITAGDQQ